ncbi:MAG TPA: HNH endonuclease signature motif containing protein [Gemmataceae bacterium]|nr:HNH endonuclease signature motif containing protein [Gemmataceae bacterium]
MKASIRALVRARARQRCEYCRPQESDLPLFSFHVEHILPKKHGGTDDPKTLAWSCHYCNLSKIKQPERPR